MLCEKPLGKPRLGLFRGPDGESCLNTSVGGRLWSSLVLHDNKCVVIDGTMYKLTKRPLIVTQFEWLLFQLSFCSKITRHGDVSYYSPLYWLHNGFPFLALIWIKIE